MALFFCTSRKIYKLYYGWKPNYIFRRKTKMEEIRKTAVHFGSLLVGVGLLCLYGHVRECQGYMRGVVVTAKAYEEKRAKELENNEEETED